MPFTDPNAAAAANARAGLGNVANFLYEQQVQKPATQAQTAETQARTAMMVPQTQALQSEIVAQTLQNKANLFQQLSQHPIINTDAINAAVNGAQTTDVPQAPASTNAGTESPQVSTSTAGQGASGGEAGSSSSPTPNIPRTSPQLDSSAGSETFDSSGNPTNARPAANTTKPGTLAQPKLPYTNDELSPLVTQPGLHPFSETPARGATTSPTPVTSPVSPVPAIKSPASPASPASPKGNFDYRNELGTPFYALPQAAQTELLSQMRKPFDNAGLPVSDQELIGHYQQLQSQMIPPLMQNPNFIPTGVHGGQVEGVFGNAIDRFGGGGTSTGNSANQARIFDPTVGHYVDNPAFTKPADVQSTQSDLANLDQADTMVSQAKNAIKTNPSVVGKIGGSWMGNLTRAGESVVGNSGNYAGEREVQQFLSKQFLNTLQDLHVGRVLEKEYNAVVDGMPQQSDPPEVWNNFFNSRLEPFLAKVRASKEQELNAQTGGQPQSILPPVSVGPSVSAPKSSASGMQTFSPEEAAKLPKGYGSFMGTNGKLYSK